MISSAALWIASARMAEAKCKIWEEAIDSREDWEAMREADYEDGGIPVGAWLGALMVDAFAWSQVASMAGVF